METYPDSIEEKLGFDVIRDRLRDNVRSALGEERLDAMKPARTIGWLEDELGRVAELQDAFRYADRSVPLRHVRDVRPVLRRAAPEDAYVDPEELQTVRRVLITLRRVKRYFEQRAEEYPLLAEAVERITPLPDLVQHIRRVVDDDDTVRDDASPELQRIRQQIIQRKNELRDTLDREMRKAVGKGYATEQQPTLRGGRMVIPVRAEAKRKVDGFVHATSASGQTVYIEPTSCLELNNEVRELKSAEKREVERILREVTAHLRTKRSPMDENMKALAQLDLLQAKAELANRLDAVTPHLNTDGVVEIVDGRNPVLELHFESRDDAEDRGPLEDAVTDEVVPLDLQLGREYRTLVITGPNAGGKTVSMKTVGLFALMLAYGLPLPLAPHSHFALFDEIIVDIGDEQSIEEDLSTFSSHVTNLRHMLEKAGDGSLVLIDEAGTGTDPEEGGALAQAVLEQLTAARARTIATTHHGLLKVYAHDTEHVQNGSMEFDQETLRPTYRFQSGVPGSSYAFEIADRMGLDADLLDRARTLAGEQKTAMEELIATFESRNQALQERIDEAEQARRAAERERDQYEQKVEKLEKEREEIRAEALEEAERIVNSANARIENTIREIKEAQAEREATQKAREKLEQFKEEVGEAREDTEKELEELDEEQAPDEEADASDAEPARQPGAPIEEGDEVVVDDGSMTGEVEAIENGEAVVLVGSMHMHVDVDRLTKVGGGAPAPESSTPSSSGSAGMPALRASDRIDVRGQRVEGALQELEPFLDEAIAADLHQVEILHGTGTGALREAIHNELERRPDVADFGKADWDAGGAGVTVVELA